MPDEVTRSAWAVLVLAESDPAGRADLLPWITGRSGPPGRTATPTAGVRADGRARWPPSSIPPWRRSRAPATRNQPGRISPGAERTIDPDLDSTRSPSPPDGLAAHR